MKSDTVVKIYLITFNTKGHRHTHLFECFYIHIAVLPLSYTHIDIGYKINLKRIGTFGRQVLSTTFHEGLHLSNKF